MKKSIYYVVIIFPLVFSCMMQGMFVTTARRTSQRTIKPNQLPLSSSAPSSPVSAARTAAYKQQVARAQKEQIPTFGGATQGRTYRTSPITATQYNEPKKTIWEQFSSWFKPAPKTPQEFIGEFEKCTYRNGEWTAPSGRFYVNKLLFDDSDLQKAKKMIDEHMDFINQDIPDGNIPGTVGTRHYGYNPNTGKHEEFKTLRLADRILDTILSGELFYFEAFTPSEVTVRLIELLKYALGKGAHISEVNKARFQYMYLNNVMDTFKYNRQGTRRGFGIEYEYDNMKKAFKELDLIYEQQMPEFKQQLRMAQKERAEIEVDVSAYQEKMQDQRDREDYVRAKRNLQKIEYAHQHGYWKAYEEIRDDESAPWYEVEFDEKEYKQWLKNGKSFFRMEFNFGTSGRSSRSKERTMPSGPSKTVAYARLLNVLDLTAGASETDMKEKFKKVSLENHSDRLRNLPETERVKREEYYKMVTNAYSDYNQAKARAAKQEKKWAKEAARQRASE